MSPPSCLHLHHHLPRHHCCSPPQEQPVRRALVTGGRCCLPLHHLHHPISRREATAQVVVRRNNHCTEVVKPVTELATRGADTSNSLLPTGGPLRLTLLLLLACLLPLEVRACRHPRDPLGFKGPLDLARLPRGPWEVHPLHPVNTADHLTVFPHRRTAPIWGLGCCPHPRDPLEVLGVTARDQLDLLGRQVPLVPTVAMGPLPHTSGDPLLRDEVDLGTVEEEGKKHFFFFVFCCHGRSIFIFESLALLPSIKTELLFLAGKRKRFLNIFTPSLSCFTAGGRARTKVTGYQCSLTSGCECVKRRALFREVSCTGLFVFSCAYIYRTCIPRSQVGFLWLIHVEVKIVVGLM